MSDEQGWVADTTVEVQAWALVAIACLTHTLVSWEYALLVPLGAAIVAYPYARGRVRPKLSAMGYIILALPIALLMQVKEVVDIAGGRFNNNFYVGLYATAAATIWLYSDPNDRTRMPRILLFTAATMSCAAAGLTTLIPDEKAWYFQTVDVLHGTHFFYAVIATIYSLVALVALRTILRVRPGERSSRRLRMVAIALSFFAVAAVTFTINRVVLLRYHELTDLYAGTLGNNLQSGRGFSEKTKIGNVMRTRGDDGEEIAIRAFSPLAPGYLRGKIFYTYQKRTWTAAKQGADFAIEEERFEIPGFEAPEPDTEPALSVFPSDRYNAVYFLPKNASAIETASGKVAIYPGPILRSIGSATSEGYGVLVQKGSIHVDGDRGAYTRPAKNEALRAELQKLIAKLELRGKPPKDVVGDLTTYFNAEYTYEFGIQFKKREDPLVQFLRDKRHGHCELFASIGTLILRELGIPSRYVTGFVCDEANPIADDLWVARNKHAHAWCEYYTEESGWELCELTPAEGLPQFEEKDGTSALTDWLTARFDQAMAWLSDTARRVPKVVLDAFKTAGQWLLDAWWRMGLLVLVIVGYLFRNRFRRASGSNPLQMRGFSEELQRERERYFDLQRRLTEVRLHRADSETLLEFATRLESADTFPPDLDRPETLAFLRTFALKRYGPDVLAP